MIVFHGTLTLISEQSPIYLGAMEIIPSLSREHPAQCSVIQTKQPPKLRRPTPKHRRHQHDSGQWSQTGAHWLGIQAKGRPIPCLTGTGLLPADAISNSGNYHTKPWLPLGVNAVDAAISGAKMH